MEYNPQQGWEYESHPNFCMVEKKCNQILTSMSDFEKEQADYLGDTRPMHRLMFCDVTPKSCDYFAGNYRGENYQYLVNYNVSIGGFLGVDAELVDDVMKEFSSQLAKVIDEYESKISELDLSENEKLLTYVELIAYFFAKFLVIHPYANGNGHMARLLVWVLLKQKGLHQEFWAVSERPGVPKGVPLDECIHYFRLGSVEHLNE